jgi:probable phosphoglycerate mutase
MTQSLFGNESGGAGHSTAHAHPRELVINVDGGARGNPGPAGYGAYVRDAAGNTVAELSEFIGIATNNVAEYRGLLAGLEYAREHQAHEVKVYSDSELIVKQMHGEYKVKSPDLKPLYEQVRRLASDLAKFSIHHVPRERNADADRLANQAMDRGARGGFGQVKSTPAEPVRPAARGGVKSAGAAAEPEQVFTAVVRDGTLRPAGPGGPVLEEGRSYEVRIRKQSRDR